MAVLNGSGGVYSASTLTSSWVNSAAFHGVLCHNVQDGNPPGTPAYLAVSLGPLHAIAIDLGAETLLNGTLTMDTVRSGLSGPGCVCMYLQLARCALCQPRQPTSPPPNPHTLPPS